MSEDEPGDGETTEQLERSKSTVQCFVISPVSLKREIDMLICRVNKVTAYHRHGQKIPTRALDALSNQQLDTEKAIRKVGL